MREAPERSRWTGRVDAEEGPRARRWHQEVRPLAPGAAPGPALLGFACDAGVIRNQGRPGAAMGPDALRTALANLAWHRSAPVWDAGDVVVVGDELESGQAELRGAVAELLAAGHLPLVVGGGHEVAHGSFLGLLADEARRADGARLGVLNLDAHLDLRAGRASSGTPFRQSAEAAAARGLPFRYFCLGLDEAANTGALLDTAARLGARLRLDREATPARLPEVLADVAAFLGEVDRLHLTIDLDVLPGHVAPGVSAPAARGVALEVVEAVVDAAVASGKLALGEVAELCPRLDLDGRTAKVAARLVVQLARAR